MGTGRARKRVNENKVPLASLAIHYGWKRQKLELELANKSHSMLTRSGVYRSIAPKNISETTNQHPGLKKRVPGLHATDQEESSEDSSDDECSQEDPRCKEVRLLTESVVNSESRSKDTKKPAVSDECITSITIIARHLANKTDTKMVIYVAGAIESVENCTKLVCEDQIVISIKTIWIYNKEFRAEITQLWEESTPRGFLPHIAFLIGNRIVELNSTSDNDNSIVFQNSNIEFIHTILTGCSESSTKYCWEIVTKVEDLRETVVRKETRKKEMFSIQGSLQDFENEAIACSKASFFLDIKSSSVSTSSNRTQGRFLKANGSRQGNNSETQISQDGACNRSDRRPSIIATMSFTKIGSHPRATKRKAVILSLGSQSKFVTAQPTEVGKMVMDAKELVLEFRQNYQMNRNYHWGIAACELDGTLDELERLAAFIQSQWVIPPDKKQGLREETLLCYEKQLSDIACHTLYFDTGTEHFVPHSFHSTTARKFEKLKKRRKNGDCHIECYSHVAREKALHDYFYNEDKTYRSDWETETNFDHFYNKHYSTLPDDKIECVSFKYPTIQFGFQKHRDEHAIFFQNTCEGTKHHKFISDIGHDPKLFDPRTFKRLLLSEWMNQVRNL